MRHSAYRLFLLLAATNPTGASYVSTPRHRRLIPSSQHPQHDAEKPSSAASAASSITTTTRPSSTSSHRHHRRAPHPPLLQQPSSPSAPSDDLPFLLRAEPALALGGLLLTLLVGNRLFTDDLLNSQSRSDLIAALAPVLIILKALGDIDITPREADRMPLTGVQGTAWVEPALVAPLREELAWAADTLLETIDACAAVALYVGGRPPPAPADGGDGAGDESPPARGGTGRTLLLRGTLPKLPPSTLEADAISPGPLLSKAAARKTGAPDYLPALQLLPGRVEFGYFPEDSQGVLMLPLTGAAAPGALVLAADRQRGFDEDDTEWARAIAARISEALAENRV